jgi:hypothetical protein
MIHYLPHLESYLDALYNTLLFVVLFTASSVASRCGFLVITCPYITTYHLTIIKCIYYAPLQLMYMFDYILLHSLLPHLVPYLYVLLLL